MNDLHAANLIMRRGHRMYGVTDPFVQEMWREKKFLEMGELKELCNFGDPLRV